ncbi:hypothetical protein [Parasphingorhabdus sp.]|uniref:hypothetical protein n=1 Tax=Parasphingorhabdus sp. TaxID=2709688 RepID=UPI003C77966D
MTSGNIDVHALIEKLQDILKFLDENEFAIPAIKVEEAINALQQIQTDQSAGKKTD